MALTRGSCCELINITSVFIGSLHWFLGTYSQTLSQWAFTDRRVDFQWQGRKQLCRVCVCYVGSETFHCQVTPLLPCTCSLRVCLCVGVGLCVCAAPIRRCVEARRAGFLRLPAGRSGRVRDSRQHHQSHLHWCVWATARQGACPQAECPVCMWVRALVWKWAHCQCVA